MRLSGYVFVGVSLCLSLLVAHELPQKPFFCARHGVTEWNILQKQQGKTDIPLHALGRQQAERMRALFDTLPITHFWSSTLSRAYETMRIVNATRKLPEYMSDDLQERGKGALEGITAQEWNKLDQSVITAAIENWDFFAARTERIMSTILSGDGVPCIIAHSNNIRYIARLTGNFITDVPSDAIWYFEPPRTDAGSWTMTMMRDRRSPEPIFSVRTMRLLPKLYVMWLMNYNDAC